MAGVVQISKLIFILGSFCGIFRGLHGQPHLGIGKDTAGCQDVVDLV
jgi:hypothetical protein